MCAGLLPATQGDGCGLGAWRGVCAAPLPGRGSTARMVSIYARNMKNILPENERFVMGPGCQDAEV